MRYYGKWMRDEAERRIGHLYPKADSSGREAGDSHRVALGSDGDVPEPRVSLDDAARSQLLAGEEEG